MLTSPQEFELLFEGTSTPFGSVESIPHEVDAYLAEPTPSIHVKALDWWKNNRSRFPRMVLLACKYLCIPATSIASERTFSTAGNIVTKKRASLGGDTVDILVFLNKNIGTMS